MAGNVGMWAIIVIMPAVQADFKVFMKSRLAMGNSAGNENANSPVTEEWPYDIELLIATLHRFYGW